MAVILTAFSFELLRKITIAAELGSHFLWSNWLLYLALFATTYLSARISCFCYQKNKNKVVWIIPCLGILLSSFSVWNAFA